MRAKEFLVEYNRQVTMQNWGQKLLAAIRKDPTYKDRTEVLDHVPPENRPQVSNTLIEKLLSVIESSDPTPHKEYVQWMCKIYSLGTVKLEDLETRGFNALENFHMLKKSSIMPPVFRDINRYRSLDQLMVEVNHYMAQVKQKEITDQGQFNIILDDENITIRVPLDKQAAIYWGQNTDWCTATKTADRNMFDRYNKMGNLYIVTPKNPAYPKEQYQFHFQSNQIMNEKDNPVDVMPLIQRWPELMQALHPAAEEAGYIPMMRAGPKIIKHWANIKDEAKDNILDRVENILPNILNSVRNELPSEANATSEEAMWLTRATSQAFHEDYVGLVESMLDKITPQNFNNPELDYEDGFQDSVEDWIQNSAIAVATQRMLDGPTTNYDGYPGQMTIMFSLVNHILPIIKDDIKYIISTYY